MPLRKYRVVPIIAALLLLALVLGGLPARPLAAQGPGGQTTLEQILTTSLPIRDPVDLAVRLNRMANSTAPDSARPPRWEPGAVSTFWADNISEDRQFQVRAVLQTVTDAVYIWVEEGVTLDEAALQHTAETFTTITYPTVRAVFGAEPSPGIDGDPRLHILMARGLGAGVAAYFGTDSLYPAEFVPASNEREMFFVNLDTMASALGTPYFDGVLAHEFQHMIHAAQDLNEDAWLDEGMAELASLLTGFDGTGFVPQFFRQPTIQLTTWPEVDSTIPHYGASFLFTTYFHGRFGDEGTRLLVAAQENGLAGVDAVLAALDATDPLSGAPLTALDLFADWTAANLLNAPGLVDGRFGYGLLNGGLGRAEVAHTVATYPTTLKLAAPQFSATYVTLKHVGPGRIQIAFDGTATVPLVAATPHSGAFMWYSNRGDSSDARLTRAFDLRGVSAATLEFALWYDIEALWDYGYVMVSTDGGATWTPLAGRHTTTEDPHHNAYGPAYTGDSGGGEQPAWVQEQIDLTPYAGQEVLVRFELITDEAVNTPGMLIDDVRIPEIGYAEDFESGPGGWQAEGWLYTDNVLPQGWIVQAAQPANPQAPVTRLLMPDDAMTSGTWALDVGGAAGDVTLIISPVAPLTTEPASFTLSLSRAVQMAEG
ncbi:MAG: immune inhibitor A [Anaerolineae bacterium]